MEIEVDGIKLTYLVGSKAVWIVDANTGQKLSFHVDHHLTEAEAYEKIEAAREFFEEEERNKSYYWQEYGRDE